MSDGSYSYYPYDELKTKRPIPAAAAVRDFAQRIENAGLELFLTYDEASALPGAHIKSEFIKLSDTKYTYRMSLTDARALLIKLTAEISERVVEVLL